MYDIFVSEQANKDFDDLEFAIKYEYQSPQTAFRYLQGLKNKINELKIFAEIYAIETSEFYQQFGFRVRRINYKNMVVIYTIHENIEYKSFVFIRRVMPASLIVI